jgi:uncharacterized membrane protein
MLPRLVVLVVALANFGLFYAAAYLVRRRPDHTILETVVVIAAACALAALVNRWLYRRWQGQR